MIDKTEKFGAAQRTPYREFFYQSASRRFASVVDAARRTSRRGAAVRPAYSVKTNPRREMLALAKGFGFLAEVISRDEVQWAIANDFEAESLVYNGPYRLDMPVPGKLHAIFADSIEALHAYSAMDVSDIVGVRLRPSMIESRFGFVPQEDQPAADVIRRLRPGSGFAASFHVRREDMQNTSWRTIAMEILERGLTIAQQANVTMKIFDVGGSWTPRELDETFEEDLRWLCQQIEHVAPECTSVIPEPGQAIATPTEVIHTTVVEVRRRLGRREAIVDAGYPEWSQMHAFPHSIYELGDTDNMIELASGPDRMGGRTCLEYDYVDGIALPPLLSAGDRLLIGDCGGYDHSMAFPFAKGER